MKKTQIMLLTSFLAIITHPLLDAQTTWGTQLFWPFEWRIAIENIFIIDPIYTLPFLTFLILTAFQNRLSKKRKLSCFLIE